MFESGLKDLVGNLAVLTTIFQFLSGILVCKQYVVNRTTAEASPLPFICGIVSTMLWLLYGLNKHDDNIILVNTVGLTLMVGYTIVFYIFTYKKSSMLKQVVVMVIFTIFIIGYAASEEDQPLLLGRLGSLACLLTLLTIAAPMSKLYYVIKVKSTECLPFPMILMSFFVSTLWFLYGVIEQDGYLQWPNIIGAGLSVIQLMLFLIYPSNSSQSNYTKTLLA